MNSTWLTDADMAELDVIVYKLVHCAFDHRERGCAACARGGPVCPGLAEAFEAVLDWRTFRALRSRAEWLRAREDARRAA